MNKNEDPNNTSEHVEFTCKRNGAPEEFDKTDEWEPELLVGRFRMGRKIGTGSFGCVFRGYDIVSKVHVAIKVSREIRETKTMIREAGILKYLQLSPELLGVPELFYDGTESTIQRHKFLVMSLLGLNLSQLHKLCNGTFSYTTICMIATEIITRFEELHDSGIVHRDVKPQNFLIGRYTSDRQIYVCDFGLSGRYVKDNGDHILFKTGLKPIGTARYASMRVHRGYERSRRDDFEALAYMLLYLKNGSLPWQGLNLHNRTHKWKLILQVKSEIKYEELFENTPFILGDLLVASRNMAFSQRPRYGYWKRKFLAEIVAHTNPNTLFKYDWEEHIRK